MLNKCLAWLMPLSLCSAVPLSVLQIKQREKVHSLLSVLSDVEGCSKISLPTLLLLARTQASLLMSIVNAELPVLVVPCSRAGLGCRAELAVFRGSEGNEVSHSIMCIPSMAQAFQQFEQRALGSPRCRCGGQFCLGDETREGAGCSSRRHVKLG